MSRTKHWIRVGKTERVDMQPFHLVITHLCYCKIMLKKKDEHTKVRICLKRNSTLPFPSELRLQRAGHTAILGETTIYHGK